PDTCRTIQANPYESYVTDAAGQMRCDLFIRLEHLATDMVPLCAHLGFEPELPHANRSARAASYRDSYSESDANLVAELCAADIARFDYRFDS
ncbi:MAG: Type II secretory pathway, pullulanase PulA, partial [Pseudomonadota bacterium]